MQIPRRPFDSTQGRLSPRKRGCGSLGMKLSKDLAARLEAEPFQNDRRFEFFGSLLRKSMLLNRAIYAFKALPTHARSDDPSARILTVLPMPAHLPRRRRR